MGRVGEGRGLFFASFRQPSFLTPPLPLKPLEVISHLNVSHGIHKLRGCISTWDENRKITVSLILFAKRWLRDFPLIHCSGSYSHRTAIFFRFLSAWACCACVLFWEAKQMHVYVSGTLTQGEKRSCIYLRVNDPWWYFMSFQADENDKKKRNRNIYLPQN